MIWDYIVIGAGSSGCALVNALHRADPTKTILVLEAGKNDSSPWIRLPAGQVRSLADHDWGYRSEPDPSRNGASEPWPRGRVLGGSSSVNGTVFVRGAAHDFDRWAEALGEHGATWSARNVLPIFRDIETSDQPSMLRGHSGPQAVRTVRRPHQLTKAFVAAAETAGHPFNPDYNGETQEGVGYGQLSQRRGFRVSAATAFLKPHLRSAKITLLVEAPVERIELEAGEARNVHFVHRSESRRETARDIILCAGAVNTPQLLMLSGIGPAKELRAHGIPVAIDLPGVGANLKEHPLIRLLYRVTVPSDNPTQGILQALSFAWRFVRHGEGPIANLFEGAAFLRSSESTPLPDLQLHFTPLGFKVCDGKVRLTPFPSVRIALNASYPKSVGRIRLASADPGQAPRIECRLLDHPDDVDTLVRGIGVVRRIMASKPIADVVAEELVPGPAIDGPQALVDYVRQNTEIDFHPVGTCRMGLDGSAVVDSGLLVCGMRNLWIADASVMPDLISGNTNAVCLMIGTKLGRELAARPSVKQQARSSL